MDWIDIHSHILPGFDDGASNDDEFMAIARAAAGSGTCTMAATPHFDLDKAAYSPSETAESVTEHNLMLTREKIPLTLVAGMEVRINAGLSNLADEPDKLRALTLGGHGKFMLVDLPMIDMPVAIDEIFFKIQLGGITPILAHPERNRYLVEHPEAPVRFVDHGVELQLDSGSLTGLFGKTAQKSAKDLLKDGLARLVASDAHEAQGRGPDLSGAAGVIRDLLGKEAPELVLKTNPGRVLEGQRPLETAERQFNVKSGKSKIWKKLR